MTNTPGRPGGPARPGPDRYPGRGGPPPGPGRQPGPGYPPPGPGYPPPGRGPAGPPWSAPRPGIVALGPLDLGDVLGGALRYVGSQWRVVLGVPAVGMVVYLAVQFLLQLRIASAATPPGADGGFAQRDLVDGGLVLEVVLVVLAAVLIFPGTLSVLYSVLMPAVLGRRVPFGVALRLGLRRTLPMLGLYLLLALVGLLAVGVFGLLGALVLYLSDGAGAGIAFAVVAVLVGYGVATWIGTTLVFAPVALIVEGAGVGAALARSRALVRGAWWPTFGTLLLGGLVVGVAAMVVMIPFSLVGAAFVGIGAAASDGAAGSVPGLVPYLLVIAVGLWVVLTAAVAYTAGLVGTLYLDRRMRTEDLGRRLAAQAGVPGA